MQRPREYEWRYRERKEMKPLFSAVKPGRRAISKYSLERQLKILHHFCDCFNLSQAGQVVAAAMVALKVVPERQVQTVPFFLKFWMRQS